MGSASFVHVFRPPVVFKAITICEACPDCGKRTRMMGFFQEWFGWHSTCLRCGREWDDGCWLPLPFKRGARAGNIRDAKRRWRLTIATGKISDPPRKRRKKRVA